MATLKQRLHRKNSSGSYDVVHLETSSDLVKRANGSTVEASLTTIETKVNGAATTSDINTHNTATNAHSNILSSYVKTTDSINAATLQGHAASYFAKAGEAGALIQSYPAAINIAAGDVCDVVDGKANSSVEYIQSSELQYIDGEIDQSAIPYHYTREVSLNDNTWFICNNYRKVGQFIRIDKYLNTTVSGIITINHTSITTSIDKLFRVNDNAMMAVYVKDNMWYVTILSVNGNSVTEIATKNILAYTGNEYYDYCDEHNYGIFVSCGSTNKKIAKITINPSTYNITVNTYNMTGYSGNGGYGVACISASRFALLGAYYYMYVFGTDGSYKFEASINDGFSGAEIHRVGDDAVFVLGYNPSTSCAQKFIKINSSGVTQYIKYSGVQYSNTRGFISRKRSDGKYYFAFGDAHYQSGYYNYTCCGLYDPSLNDTSYFTTKMFKSINFDAGSPDYYIFLNSQGILMQFQVYTYRSTTTAENKPYIIYYNGEADAFYSARARVISSQAIALDTVSAGNTVRLGFDGIVDSSLPDGTIIKSGGVSGKVIGNKLSILPEMVKLGGAKIATGSYAGTAVYGSSNPNSLTFDFTPAIIFIGSYLPNNTSYSNAYSTMLIRGCSLANNLWGNYNSAEQGTASAYLLRLTWTGNTVSWYNITNAAYQLNSSGMTYYYVAIG